METWAKAPYCKKDFWYSEINAPNSPFFNGYFKRTRYKGGKYTTKRRSKRNGKRSSRWY